MNNPKLIRLTNTNANQYIGNYVLYKTRNKSKINKILGVSENRNLIYVNNADLNNNLNINRKLYAIVNFN